MNTTAFSVGVDWGSSSVRAYLFDDNHRHIDTVESDKGITRLPATAEIFERTFLHLIKDWQQPGMTVLLSGMISSRNGWVETPYIPCPANPHNLYKLSKTQALGGMTLHFLPGVCQCTALHKAECMPDVMRGEELQLLGIATGKDTEIVVLPGTHSKWALLREDEIEAFSTVPTGELFDILLKHSLIGALARSDEWSEAAFNEGVQCGYDQDNILMQLFSCRSSVLLKQRAPSESKSWLSGLLIGREIREGCALYKNDSIKLVGNIELCGLYKEAMCQLGFTAKVESGNAALFGFQKILRRM